jgi:mRNA interferase MazF
LRPHRGEIWLVDLGKPMGHEQGGRRPAVIVSADPLNAGAAGVVMVVPLTTARRELRSHVEIGSGQSGLDEVSYATCEDVKSVSDQRLVSRVGQTDPEEIFAIGRVLRLLLDL